MIRHDLQLWAYAAKELELGEHRFVEAHLEDCPECVEQLSAVRLAKEALELARTAKPRLAWAKVDARVGAMVEKRLQAQARAPLYRRLAGASVGLAMAAAAVLFVVWPREVPAPLVATEQSTPISSWARVDRAQGLVRVGGSATELAAGTELHGGDVIRTSKRGKAFVHLPDRSHLRVGADAQLALTRSEEDDVALTLERGSLAVRASHQERKAFVVHSGGVSVSVIGTVFSVTNDAEVVEVSCSEGQVRVELPNGDSTLVEPGQRFRFDTKTSRTRRLKLSAVGERELAEVAAAADEATAVEGRVMVAAVGGTPSSPPMLTAQGTPRSLPRLSPAEAKSRQVEAPAPMKAEELESMPRAAPVEESKTELIVEAPADVWPSIGGGEIIRGVPPKREVEPAPVSAPTEWEPLPAPAPAPAPAAAPKVEAKDLEAIFLARAEESVAQGTCERFLLGLEDIAIDAQKTARTEQARVLRARCFDGQMRPRQALSEYRKYLEEYPRGQFVTEAHRALGD